jgi:site-specific DNA recombinase
MFAHELHVVFESRLREFDCTGKKGKCPEPYAREEVLEACFADLLKGLVFDDQVMDWIVDALHQSHADEKKFRRDALARLQDEQSKIQNRLDKLYDDRLDGFIEPDFFETQGQRMATNSEAFSRSDRRV